MYLYIPFYTFIGGRRENITLGHILTFVTGCDHEPLLGYKMQPSIQFLPNVSGNFIPTANVCINRMNLPRPDLTNQCLPDNIFEIYDYAFSNTYYGKY